MPVRTAAPLPRFTGWRITTIGAGGLGQLGGAVVRAVVDDDDLEAAVDRHLLEVGAQPRDGVADALLLVGRHDHAQADVAGWVRPVATPIEVAAHLDRARRRRSARHDARPPTATALPRRPGHGGRARVRAAPDRGGAVERSRQVGIDATCGGGRRFDGAAGRSDGSTGPTARPASTGSVGRPAQRGSIGVDRWGARSGSMVGGRSASAVGAARRAAPLPTRRRRRVIRRRWAVGRSGGRTARGRRAAPRRAARGVGLGVRPGGRARPPPSRRRAVGRWDPGPGPGIVTGAALEEEGQPDTPRRVRSQPR